MNKIHALSENELGKVNGGAGSVSNNNASIAAKEAEFNNAWDALGLSGRTDKDDQFKSWKAKDFSGDAFTFLLPLTK